ncbi:hypothetical protein CRM22_001888 [Opisthorchis felineus]|uniref:Uncharacterized protein n=1 Tax=Opisthorchis felineus TaxID=147828 RepID=A0A4S2M8L0_OPIFE|nr:hypothetical protein CRM22_001888 [Opisthorchis felineus]
MSRGLVDGQHEKVKRELRRTADNLYTYMRSWSKTEGDDEEDEAGGTLKQHLPKSELQQIIESELGDDMQKLKEKFLILLVDNYKLREKNTLLRYEVDLHKEELQETSRDLKRLSSFWKEKRRELTFLKRVTQQQEKEIQSLLKTLSKMKENQVKNLEEKGIRPLKGPCSKGGIFGRRNRSSTAQPISTRSVK